MRETIHGNAAGAGIGLRAPHVAEIARARPAAAWLEVHAENYFGGGPGPARLMDLRRDYAVSLHGVGLSLGTAEGLDDSHLHRLAELSARLAPCFVSEHLSWSVANGVYLNDLLPLPYTEEALDVVTRNVAHAQDILGRRILVENPSRYLAFAHSTLTEPEFLAALVRCTGCGILCDVNNLFITCANLGLDADAYLAALPPEAVGEIHLAGHSRVERDGHFLLIDDHASPVAPAVWALYRRALVRFGNVPTLIEWDKDLPALDVLLGEARQAARILDGENDARAA